MASIFTRILNGELPGRIVWQDDQLAALLTKAPIRPGHTLVVTKREIDNWTDVPPDLAAHLFTSAQRIGKVIQAAFPCTKVGVALVGLEVRHVHLHLIPIDRPADFDFARQDANARDADLDAAAERLTSALASEFARG